MNNQENNLAGKQKDRMTYLLLALFFGCLGAHNFYSGHTGKGIAKLVMTALVFTAFISEIWAIIEMFTVKADANGVPFK